MVNSELANISHTKENFGGAKKSTFKRLAALTLVSMALSSPIEGDAIIDANKLKPNNTISGLESAPSLKIDFNRDWKSYGEKDKEAIKIEYRNLFMGKYVGDVDRFLSEGKELFREILRDFDETRQASLKKELEEKGVTGKPWIDFGAKVLFSWENSWKNNLNEKNRWQNYVDRNYIINLCLTKDVSKVTCKENKDPGILIVNCEASVEDGFIEALDRYKKDGIPNIVEILTNNGVCVFSSIYIEQPNLLATFDEYGAIYMNNDVKYGIPDEIMANVIQSFIYRESLGGAHLKLFALFGNNRDHFLLEATKEVLASESYLKLYKKTKDKKYLILSESIISEAKKVASYTNSTMDDVDLKANVAFMKYFKIVETLTGDGWIK